MSDDITTRLRQTRANMIGTEDEEHYWHCHDAAAEIERLRITDAERLAIQWVVGDALSVDGVSIQETLRGLLQRHAISR